MPKITPFLWFDSQAEEAAKFYVSIFKGQSKVLGVRRNGEGGPGKKGSVMGVEFRLRDQVLFALNGGPHFKFTPAISLFVSVRTQKEVDHFWNKLLQGGKPSRCGWLEDRYGLSWQIVPTAFEELVADKNPRKSAAVMQAMLGMVKLDVAALKKAHRAAK